MCIVGNTPWRSNAKTYHTICNSRESWFCGANQVSCQFQEPTASGWMVRVVWCCFVVNRCFRFCIILWPWNPLQFHCVVESETMSVLQAIATGFSLANFSVVVVSNSYDSVSLSFQLYPDNFAKREMMAFTVACRNKKAKGCDWKGALGDIEVNVYSKYLVLHYTIAMHLNDPIIGILFKGGLVELRNVTNWTELDLGDGYDWQIIFWAHGGSQSPGLGTPPASTFVVCNAGRVSGVEWHWNYTVSPDALIDVWIDFSHCKWHFSTQHNKVRTFANTASQLLCIFIATLLK